MKAAKSARRRYSEEFKMQAVKLSRDPHMQTKDVAAALAIHPFSGWASDSSFRTVRESTFKSPPMRA
jgi:hypothetical protein